MSSFTPETPIGQVVAERPSASQLFERLGVDYCCGGDRSLRAACARQGLEAQTVLRMLEAEVNRVDPVATESGQQDWTTAPLGTLIDHIVDTHHAYLRRELPRLEELAKKVAYVHGTQAPWMISVKDVFEDLKPHMKAHIEKEEEIVFPFIRESTEGEVALEDLDEDPIALMKEEHDEAGAALKRIRTLSHDFTVPEWGCNSVPGAAGRAGAIRD
jgi:Regulator of cell morphogenesis and NO signaling